MRKIPQTMSVLFNLFQPSFPKCRFLCLAAFLIALSFGLFAQTPVAHYPLNGNANDAGSNGLNGSINGTVSPTTDRFGNANSAMQFGGSGQVDIGGNLADQNFSVSIWLKPGSSQFQYANILDNNHTGFQNWVLQQDDNTLNRYVFGVHRSDGGVGLFFTLQAEVWQHLVLVKSSSSLQAYINGTLVQTTPWTGTLNVVNPFFRLGNWAGGGRNWNGGMDEVKYFNTAIDQSLVSSLFTEGGPTSPQPLAYYPFSGNADDAVGSLNGTVNGATLTTDRFGNPNSAYIFDGVNDFISTSNVATTVTDNWTMSAWVKANSLSGTPMVLQNGFDDGVSACGGYTLGFHEGKLGGYLPCVVPLITTTDVTINQWVFLAMVREFGTTKLYLNGNLSPTTFPNAPNTPFGSLTIGSASGIRFFNGAIDEVKIYNTALTSTQVLAEFNGSGSGVQQKPGSGNAIATNGTNQSVVVPNSSPVNFAVNQDFTLDFWLKVPTENQPDQGLPDNSIIEKWDGTEGYPFVIRYMNQGSVLGKLQLAQYDGISPSGTAVLSNRVLNDGKFHHITAQRVGSEYRIYVDGILDATAPSLSSGNTQNSDPIFIGKRGGNSNFFMGSLDEIRIWNTALSQAQIRDRMCRKITSGDALFSNLVAYYNFDESAGNSVFDGTANANHGTLTNGPTRVASRAAIGNNSSHTYVSSGFPTANLSANGQDNLAVSLTSGTFTGEAGTHIYAVSEKPNTESGIENPGSNDRYFGVFHAGISNPQYIATYNYTGNGFVTAGNESQLALFKRGDNAETNWVNAGATLNPTSNTLTVTGQSTEYVLGVANCTTPPTPTISASGSLALCSGDSVTLTSSSSTGNIWSNGATSQSIKVKTAGSFTVQVILAGCSSAVSTASVVTVISPPIAAVISSPSGNSFCSGSSITLQSDQSTGLQWLRNGSNIIGQTSGNLVVSTAGIYSVKRTQNGCSSISNTLDISENTAVPPVPVINSGGQTSFCANASLGLLSSATEGNQWTRNGTDIIGATSNTFTATQAGTYAVRVTVGGCSRTSANLVLTTLPAPTVSISTSGPGICPESPVVLSTTGTALSAREWLKDGSSTAQFGTTFSASVAGSYAVMGTAANGCQTTSAAVNVQADAVPTLTSNQPANTICSGNAISLTASPGAGFLWSNGATTSSITVSPGTTTNFSVQTTGALGCVFNNSVTVTVVPSLTPGQVSQMVPDNGSINQENTITFSWQPASNALAYDLYVWPSLGVRPGTPNANGITGISAELNNLNFGTLYTYQVVSRSACQSTDGPVQQFTTRSLPDLVVSHVQAQAVFGVPAQYTVTYTVTNQGTGVSLPGTWKDRLFLSLDSAEGADIELQVKDNLNALAPGASYNATFQLVVEQAGEFLLYVKTDANGQVIESNEGNNLSFRNPGRVLFQEIIPTPDLVSGPGGITTNQNAVAGLPFQFNYLVKNVGNARAIGLASLALCGPPQCNPVDSYWEDFAYISTDSIFGPNAIPIGRVVVNPRKARAGMLPDCEECNAYYSKSRFLEIDSSMVASSTDLVIPHNISGKAFVFVRMNEGEGKFNERFKQNNLVQSKGFNVILRPPADLQVNSVTLTPTSSQQGNFVKVKYRIKNMGVNSPISTEMQWMDKVYLSTRSVLDKNTAIVLSAKVFPLSFLGNNEQYDDSVTFQVPFLNTNPLFVFVEADAGNIVFEHTFKANNLSSANQLNLDLSKKPDYVPSGFTAPASVQAGSAISPSLTISNAGNANGNGTFQTAFRLKQTGSLDAPIEISRIAASSLLISGNTVVSKSITIPANTAPGQYELSVFSDADNTQPELNEGNNILTRTLTVTAAPAFDLGITSITSPSTVDIFQNQPSFPVGGEAFYNTIQSGPGLPTDITLKILVSQNADGTNPLYTKQTVLSFPSGVPASFTIPNQTINRNTVPQGNYFVVMELITGSAFETNGANNKLSKAIFFETSPTPDIVFATTPSTLTLVSGQAFSIPLEIKNTGVNELQGTCVTKAMLSNSPSTTNLSFNTVGTSAKIPGIFLMPTNQLVKDTIRGFIPLSYSGNYFLQLVTEADNKTYEGAAGEANNVITIPIVISPPVLPDLVVDPLVLPANIEAGRRIAFNYTLRNNGLGGFSGSPKNNFRLSKTGVFNPFTDSEVGTDQPTVNLGPGANSVFPGALRANGLLPGAYKRGAFVNSTFTSPESSFANNETYSTSTSNLFINPLALNVTASETGFIGDYFYRSVNIGAGFDILGEFTGQQGYASLGKVPTASAAEFSSVDNLNKEILIPNSEAGQYFFGVAPNSAGPVTLKVRALPFSILSLSPNRVGKGNVTTEIKGAAFTSQTLFVLRNAGGTHVDTGTIRILRNSMQARVTFHCANLPIGFYTVRAIKPGNEFTDLVNGLQVVAKNEPKLASTDNFPSEISASATVNLTYTFTNTGNTDIENGLARLSFPTFADVKNIVISSGADGLKSMMAKSRIYDLDQPVQYEQYDFLTFIPAWKRNIAPGESFQISFQMSNFQGSSDIYIQSFGQSLSNKQFYQSVANQVEKVRAFSMQFREEIDNQDILDSLGGYWSWQHLAYNNLFQAGFFKSEDRDSIVALDYYPSIYQPELMKGYGIVGDPSEVEDLSLRLLCPAPLSEYNLPTDKALYFTISNGALVTYSSNFRRTAQDLIVAACAGDTNEFKRRLSRQYGGGGFEGNLLTGFAYGPMIYTDIFGEYRPGQPFIPGSVQTASTGPGIFSSAGGFWGNFESNNERELFRPRPRTPRPAPPKPTSPKPSSKPFDPTTNFGDPGPLPFKKPDAECAGKPAPDCEVRVFAPKKVRCGQEYTVRTLIICHTQGDFRSTFCFPNTPFIEEKVAKVKRSCDPNEIEGPVGFGDSKFVAKTDVLPYTIRFENDPKFADAAAGTVRITQPLDAHFEQGTFRLKQFGFENRVFDVPAGQSSFSTQIDLTAERGIKVNVLGTIDIISKQLFWQFETVDAATGQASVDPTKGFLPVNDSTGKGEGFVSYTIQPGLSTQTGDSLRAQAEIVFDFNEAIFTNRHFNVIDALPPTTSVSTLSGTQEGNDIELSWTVQDDEGGSGAFSTWIFFKKDGGALDTLGQYPADTGSIVGGGFESGHTYQFFFRSNDWVGNPEAMPNQPNVTISVGSPCNLPKPSITVGGSLSFCAGDSVILTSSALFGNRWSTGDTTRTIRVKGSGKLAVLTVLEGCSSAVSDSVTVLANPLPAKPLVTANGPLTFCQGGSVTLTTNSPAGHRWSNGSSLASITVSAPGSFADTAKARGCLNVSDPVVVTVNPLPVVNAGLDVSIEAGQSATLAATGASTFQWAPLQNMTPATGVGASVSVNPIQTTLYSVIGTDTNNCFASDAVLVTVTGGSGPLTAPLISPGTGTYDGPQMVAITSTSPGAEIYFTTTGNTPVVGTGFTRLYTGPFQVLQTTTIRAIAVKAGQAGSPVSVSFLTLTNPGICAAPIFSPAPGTYEGSVTLSLSTATPDGEIWYTTNGNNPRFDVPNSFTRKYSGPFVLYGSTTLKAVSLKPGLVNSPVVSAHYTITNPAIVATPTFSPLPGNFGSAQSITLSTSTPGAQIFYTTNGNVPRVDVPNSFTRQYTGPFLLSQSATLRAIAVRTNWQQSGTAVGLYTFGGARGAVAEMETRDLDDIRIFPNPSASGVFQVVFPESGEETVSYSVLALDGKEIQKGTMTTRQPSVLDLGSFPPGLYQLKIQWQDRVLVLRLITE